MLGNGYKERLANAQNSIGSLILNLSKASSSPQLQQQHQENEHALDDSSFVKNPAFGAPFHQKGIASSSLLPLPPAPAMESNSASRHASQKQLPPPLQQPNQARSSRLPNAPTPSTGMSRFSFDKVLGAEEFIPSLHGDSSYLGVASPPTQSLSSSHSTSGWEWPQGLPECDNTPMSNSPKKEGFPLLLGNGRFFKDSAFARHSSLVSNGAGSSQTALDTKVVECGISIQDTALLARDVIAARVIQRAVRRFLLRKHTKANKEQPEHAPALAIPGTRQPVASSLSARNAALTPLVRPFVPQGKQPTAKPLAATTPGESHCITDTDLLQEICLRQSNEINQLKEQVSKMRLEAEDDKRKLRQKDKEIEELLKLQRLSTSVTLSSAYDSSLSLSGNNGNIKGVPKYSDMMNDGMQSATIGPMDLAISASVVNGAGVSEDLYEPSSGYGSHYSTSAGNVINPFSSGVSSRSNSIHSLQTQQQPQSQHQHQQHAGLKLNLQNVQPFYAQYQAFVDIHGLAESPSVSDFGSAHGDLMSSASTHNGFATPTPTSATVGRGLVAAVSQHGYGSQGGFPNLKSRQSGSFSAASRAFESPALEQQGVNPWKATHLPPSEPWNDEATTGFSYDQSAPYHTGGGGVLGHSNSFDPNSYVGQQQTQQQLQQVQQQTQQHPQQHQPTPPFRNNYRRHSEKPVHLDYQMCVDRILQATDQQASIHLQQKLKTSPPEQKVAIIDAILGQAYPLMSNRFGNFLIQRCFEFGTPQQIDALALAMRGNILSLACDPFGCHVVQKALDNVEEDCKARIVTEMFRRICDTIVHRYACHVWQKVFEIRWTDAPPAVMTYVNSAVSGKWASVAVDETGSLVVQNIFENCAEHDKRPVLNEILKSVTTIAKGQWGNWVIQHILEHGSPSDRAAATQKILEDVVALSLDQYASKVVEKTLRMAAQPSNIVAAITSASLASSSSSATSLTMSTSTESTPQPPTVTVNNTTISLTQEEVMGQYIHIVCDGVPDRPRIPLIDIASDQYGNYIVQYILTNAGPQHRETCAALIKRHMVSLRGSKYGQKVAFMVERWRGSPFSGNNNNGGGAAGNGHSSKGGVSGGGGGGSGGESGSSGGGNGGGRRRW
ncbi:hypothetical protein BG004_000284 [Podila humilis]|nr:hypothetical protein BG004_000284 [Podila humilis]